MKKSTVTYPDGLKYTGEWKDDKFVRIRIFDKVLN